MALTKLHDKAQDEGRRTEIQIQWEIDAIQARLEPTQVPLETLQRYAGQYGPRSVTLELGNLHYQRARGPKYRLAPVSSTVFIVGLSGFRLEF